MFAEHVNHACAGMSYPDAKLNPCPLDKAVSIGLDLLLTRNGPYPLNAFQSIGLANCPAHVNTNVIDVKIHACVEA